MDVQGASDPLREGFEHPPPTAQPRLWFHWMDGNVTEEGIRRDLEWMHRIGIGGLQAFDLAFSTSPRVRRLRYMSPEWQQAFRTAAERATQLGLELSVAGSPGFSESGAPWVKPERAMKKLVWSTSSIDGGKRFLQRIPAPPATIGPFQNVPIDHTDWLSGGRPKQHSHEVYSDVAVVAYRVPSLAHSMADSRPTVTSSAGPIDGASLRDGDLSRALSIPFARNGAAWIQISFTTAQKIYAISLARPDYASSGTATLFCSRDGYRFSKVIELPRPSNVQQTVAFPAVSARYFRLRLVTPAPVDPGAEGEFIHSNPLTAHRIAELILHATPRVDRAEEKAGFFQGFYTGPDLEEVPTPTVSSDAVLHKKDLLNLTDHMRPDGTLDWTPPPGRWEVMRFGYSLLGTTNHPASPEGTGLEVDKLNRAHVENYVRQYLDRFAQFLGPDLIGQHGLHGMVNDSAEVGAQNWTETLPEEFARRRGYELIPWLPALTGRVIDSSETTERFLWDFRKTLAELLAENHYGVIAEELHQHGMIHYAEAHEVFRAFNGDGMATKRFADIPMGAMWAGGSFGPGTGDADIRESASVAHLYGQNLVAAESMTTSEKAYAYTPETLKPIADRELLQGVNRFVIHASVHQPSNEPGPGLSLGPFGQWFTRHETWAEQARPWMTYLSRCSYLLQQGHFVADVLYFYGEDSNITALYGAALPPIPEGFNFDFTNAEALALLSVENGQLVTRSGMRYDILALDPRTRVMSLPVLLRLRELVEAGATVVGAKPRQTPSLADDVTTFRSTADALWGSHAMSGERRVGRGRVIGRKLPEALAQLHLEPDFGYRKPRSDSRIGFTHRHLSDGELYFVNNRQPRAERIDADFRVSGKIPELWHPDTGRIEQVSYRINGKQTQVPLQLDPTDSVFVVFRKPAVAPEATVTQPHKAVVAILSGPWTVHFSSAQGAPQATRFPQLLSWTKSTEPGIKYYSGTATYEYRLGIASPPCTSGGRLELNLGTVKDLAQVLVNATPLGVAWKAPFRLDATDAIHVGQNRLEVQVTNTWVNRLIGDKQPGAKPYAYAAFDPYEAHSPLLASGLLGPVTLECVSPP